MAITKKSILFFIISILITLVLFLILPYTLVCIDEENSLYQAVLLLISILSSLPLIGYVFFVHKEEMSKKYIFIRLIFCIFLIVWFYYIYSMIKNIVLVGGFYHCRVIFKNSMFSLEWPSKQWPAYQ